MNSKFKPKVKVEMRMELPNQKMIDWRRRHDFTQQDAADYVGLSLACWMVYELGRREAPGYLLEQMPDIIPGRRLAS